jgi:hypothetical protein
MTIEERIKYLKEQIFYLSMKDRWTPCDYQKDREMNQELIKLMREGG